MKNFRGLPRLSDALRMAESKAWYLNNRKSHPVSDPTTTPDRLTLADHIQRYLAEKSGCAKTPSAHRLAQIEFQTWAHKIKYVDEITKPLLRKFFDYLVDDDDDGTNTPFTAAHKLMKINSVYRTALNLDPGKGVITKKDYKRELVSSKVPKIYSQAEMDFMFRVMDEDEHLVFSVFHQAGLRKKELMHLEDTDLIMDELVPGKWKCEVKLESKAHWRYLTKTGATRNVVVPKDLMDRLQRRKATSRRSSCSHPASTHIESS